MGTCDDTSGVRKKTNEEGEAATADADGKISQRFNKGTEKVTLTGSSQRKGGLDSRGVNLGVRRAC